MTVQEVVNNLSDTFLCDDRILSIPERELLINLLLRANTEPGTKQHMTETIASAVGQLIAERAYGILGNRLVERYCRNPVGHRDFHRGPSRSFAPVLHLLCRLVQLRALGWVRVRPVLAQAVVAPPS